MRLIFLTLVLGVAAFAQPLAVNPGSHVVLAEYEAWFGPNAVNFEFSPSQPLLQSASMKAAGLAGYDSADPLVIQQHAAWLTGIGVDAVLVDMTNGVTCAFLEAWQPYCGAAGYASFQEIKANVGNLYPAFAQLGTPLKIVPLVSGADPTYFAIDTNGKTSIEEELDWFSALIAQYPNQAVSYLGKPLVIAYIGCPTDLTPAAIWRQMVAIAAKYPGLTFRLMGGFQDSQQLLWDNANGLDGLREMSASYPDFSWVDRLSPANNLFPTYALYAGQAENLTASIATPGQSGWGNAATGVYDPETALTLGGATVQAFFAYARALQPTFVILHQFNEYGENGWDPNTTTDFEPNTFNTGLLPVLQQEITKYKAAVAPPAPQPPAPPAPPYGIVSMAIVAGGQTTPINYNTTNGDWYWNNLVIQFGLPGDLPLLIEWSGAQHIGVFRPASGQTIVNTDNATYHGDNQLILGPK